MQDNQPSPASGISFRPATPPPSSAEFVLPDRDGFQHMHLYTADQVAERIEEALRESSLAYEQRISVLETELERLRAYVVSFPVPPLEEGEGLSQPPFTQQALTLSQNTVCSIKQLSRTISSLSIEKVSLKRPLEEYEDEKTAKFNKYETDDDIYTCESTTSEDER